MVLRKLSDVAGEVVDSAVAPVGVKRSSKRCVVGPLFVILKGNVVFCSLSFLQMVYQKHEEAVHKTKAPEANLQPFHSSGR